MQAVAIEMDFFVANINVEGIMFVIPVECEGVILGRWGRGRNRHGDLPLTPAGSGERNKCLQVVTVISMST